MSDDEPKIINAAFNVWTVDNRDSFRRGDNHPSLIYLYTVLRWAVEGTYNQESVHDAAQIIRKNDSALASVQALLADGIESGSVAVFNVHTRIGIGRAEKESLVSHLRTMDVKSSVTSLVGESGLNYFLDGESVCRFLAEKFIPTNDDCKNGALWHNLMREVPSEWLTYPAQTEIRTAPAKVEAAQTVKPEAVPVTKPAPVTQGNKLRRNSLDPAIDKAIKQAGNMELAAVYLELKELALSGEKPFTGALDVDALCYTNDNNEPAKLTKDALGKRLKNRRQSPLAAVSGQ